MDEWLLAYRWERFGDALCETYPEAHEHAGTWYLGGDDWPMSVMVDYDCGVFRVGVYALLPDKSGGLEDDPFLFVEVRDVRDLMDVVEFVTDHEWARSGVRS